MTTLFDGTSRLTNAPAAISTLSPIETFPQTVEFAKSVSLFPIVRFPAFAPLSMTPIVVPLKRVIFVPNLAFALTVMFQG